VVDDKGKVMLEVAVVTDPDAIKPALNPHLGRLRRVGHEAGSLSPWLHPERLKVGRPAVCLETQHVCDCDVVAQQRCAHAGLRRSPAKDFQRSQSVFVERSAGISRSDIGIRLSAPLVWRLSGAWKMDA
jgi:hypothetical protein